MADTTSVRGRILNRAYTLGKDGYSAKEIVAGIYEMTSAKGKTYSIDAERGSCTCECDHKYGYCKHRLGLENLLYMQRVTDRLRAWETDGLGERRAA